MALSISQGGGLAGDSWQQIEGREEGPVDAGRRERVDGAGDVLGVAPSGGMKTDSAHLFREVVVVVGDDKGLRASQSQALREAAAGRLSFRLLLRLQLSFRLLLSVLLHTPQCYAHAPLTLPLHALRCHPASASSRVGLLRRGLVTCPRLSRAGVHETYLIRHGSAASHAVHVNVGEQSWECPTTE